MAAEGTAGACPGRGHPWALASPGPAVSSALVCRTSLGKSLEVGRGRCRGLPFRRKPSTVKEGDNAPAPCPRPTLQERTPLLLRITLWDRPEKELQPPSPQTSFSGFAMVRRVGQPGRRPRPQLLTSGHRPLTWVACRVPPTLQSVSRQGQEPGTLHRAPHQPLRAAPPNPGDSRCLPPPTSPLTVSMPQRREGH